MPIDKLDGQTVGNTDPTSVTINGKLQRQMCCSKCGETKFTLRRIREAGKKVKPAKYLCTECAKYASIYQM